MRSLSRVIFALGVLALLAGLIAGVVNRQVLDGGRFAQHVDAVREDPHVARQVGLVITDRLLEQEPDLTGLRPLIESASATVVASPALGPVVRSTVTPLHRALTSGDDNQVVLRLADVGALVVAAITTLAPSTQATIPDHLDVTLASIGSQEVSRDVIGIAHTVGLLAGLLPVLGLLLLALAGILDRRDWRATTRAVGSGVMVAGGLLAVLLLVGSLVASRIDRGTLGGALGAGVWHELDASFWLVAGIVLVAGFLLRVVSSPELDLAPAALAHRGWRSVTEPRATPTAEIVRASGLVAVGLMLIGRPLALVTLGGSAVGVLLVLGGGHAVVRAAIQWWSARVADPERRAERAARRAGPAGAVVWGVVLVVVLLVGAWPVDEDLAQASVDAGTACNGHDSLCDRTYDDVAFAGTHNSMSAADQPGWFLAEQPFGILRQLDDGIRVLLIDSWNGQRTQRPGVVANNEAGRAAGFAEAKATYGSALLESALRVRDSLNLTPTGPARPYLCHALCELGSTDWEPLMVDVKGWLDRHPREVVTFFVQDEVSPEDTAALVKRAGLEPYVYVPRADGTWPTLGEMISSGRRVVFLLEHASGGTANPWLIDSRKAVQDTPYSFTTVSQFSCKRFRGPKDAPLFLVNHWLSNYTTRVTDARTVNAEGVLMPRLEKCRAERDHVPNFVAVDNYDQGDLIKVVDELNDVS